MTAERTVSALLGSHRVGFTVGTALLGVGGSVVATDARSLANWCLFLGAALLMYVEDRFADGERDARTLAKGSNKPLSTIRYDVFRDRRPFVQTSILALSLGLMVGWGALRIAETNGDAAPKNTAPKATRQPASGTTAPTATPQPATRKTVPKATRQPASKDGRKDE